MPKIYTYEECKEISSSYKTLKELIKNHKNIYSKIKNNKWHELTDHLEKGKRNKLTYEECKKIVSKYTTIKELNEKEASIVTIIRRNGWSEIISELKRIHRTNLTYEYCESISSKYNTIKELRESDYSVMTTIYTNGWSKELTKHMTKSGSKYKRCIYAYEFENEKSVYVGLTFNIEERDKQHRTSTNKSSVFKYSIENNLEIPIIKKLTEYIDRDISSKLEGIFLEKYKEDGWDILNIAKTGSLGGNSNSIEYTKEVCADLAKNCKQVSDLINSHKTAFKIIKLNNWESEMFSHMKRNPSKFKKEVAKINKETLETIEIYGSVHEATKINNMSTGHISACCNGKRKSAGGYKWEYV